MRCQLTGGTISIIGFDDRKFFYLFFVPQAESAAADASLAVFHRAVAECLPSYPEPPLDIICNVGRISGCFRAKFARANLGELRGIVVWSRTLSQPSQIALETEGRVLMQLHRTVVVENERTGGYHDSRIISVVLLPPVNGS